MSRATISVVIPTMNRPTLARTVDSADGADEVIVVGDNLKPKVGQVRIHARARIPRREGRAAELRNIGMQAATQSWVAFMDDDDVFAPGAIEVIRGVVSDVVPALYLFRMRDPWHGVLWRRPVVEVNNLGTPCLVCPSQGWKPWPTEGYQAEDYGFAEINKSTWPGGVVFREEIIAHVRPS